MEPTYSNNASATGGTSATGGGELLNDAKGLGAKAVSRVHSEVDMRKKDAVPQVEAISGAVSQVADNLGDDAPAWLKSSLEQGARQIQTFAATLERKNSRELMDDVNAFARNSPGTFLAACGAAGFAAARLFKAGATDTASPPSEPSTSAFPMNDDMPNAGFSTQSFAGQSSGQTGGDSDYAAGSTGYGSTPDDLDRSGSVQGSGTLA